MNEFREKNTVTLGDVIKYIAKIFVSFGILALCFRLIDWDGFIISITSIDPIYYFLAICVTILASIVMPAMVTWTAQRTGRLSFSLLDLVIINFSVRFYTIVLPRAFATGMRWLKYRKNNTGKDALVIIIFEKIAQMTIMMTFASLFLFLELNRQVIGQGTELLFIITIVVNLILLLLFITFFSHRLTSLLQKVTHLLGRITPHFIKSRIDSFWEAVSAFRNLRYQEIIACLFYSGISYALFIIAPYIIAKSMAIEVSIYGLAWMRAIIMLLALVPITVAGLGAREVGFITFLELYGVQRHTAFAFSLLLLFQHVFIAFIGLIIESWLHLIKPLLMKKSI